MIDVSEILVALAKKRPIFHSEADFQHAFAWEFHQNFPNASVRLELPVEVDKESFHIDVWIKNQDEVLVIELKYKTRGLFVEIDGEHYRLKNQSAQDVGRYDYIKDIQRLEQIVMRHKNFLGYAIFLTNDSAYWGKPVNFKTVDASFRIHDGRILEGFFSWGANASDGTKMGREEALLLKNKYIVHWEKYSHPSYVSYGEFRSLAIKVT